MLSTAAQQRIYALQGQYPVQQGEYIDMLVQPSEAPHSQSPSRAAAGGVPLHMPMPMALPTLPNLPSLQPYQAEPYQPDPPFLDPAFIMDDSLTFPVPQLSYDCLIPTADDDRVYYMVSSSCSSAASPALSSSPVSPGSTDRSFTSSPGGLLSDAEEFDPPQQLILPPAPPFLARPMDPAQQYYYPVYPQYQQPGLLQPPAAYPHAYPMGVAVPYYPCVDPNSLVPQPQVQPLEKPTPPKRDRRTARQRQPDYVPRPPNPFICFRQDWLRRLERGEIAYSGPRDQRTMSFRISHDWREMPEQEKGKFRREALQRKKAHAAKYPGYKFAPRQKERPEEEEC